MFRAGCKCAEGKLTIISDRSARTKLKVSFADDSRTSSAENGDPSNVVEDFCNLLDKPFGPVWIRVQLEEGQMRLSDDPEPGELMEACETISLRSVLSFYRLTGKMRLVLAYILAHSTWRYYDSDWMRARWSTDTIHFAKEHSADRRYTRIYACKPCFSVNIPISEDDVVEFYDGFVAHKYPRVLALGILLVDIGRDHPLQDERYSFEELQQRINSDCAIGINTINRDKHWPFLGGLSSAVRTKYKEITQACFDKRLFVGKLVEDYNSGRAKFKTDQTVDQNVEERRSILQKRIVAPLESLLEELDWTRALHELEPLEHGQSEYDDLSSVSELSVRGPNGGLTEPKTNVSFCASRSVEKRLIEPLSSMWQNV